MISLVVAHGKNREIGKNNKLLWHLPKDMKHFKDLTTGGTVLMGRNTFESIGRPLPDRKNFVVTSKPPSSFSTKSTWGFDELYSVDKNNVGNIIRFWRGNDVKEELFVIGGEQIYNQFLPHADRIYITLVDAEFEADRFFPEINMSEWEITDYRFEYPDKNHKYKQVYMVLDKCKIK